MNQEAAPTIGGDGDNPICETICEWGTLIFSLRKIHSKLIFIVPKKSENLFTSN